MASKDKQRFFADIAADVAAETPPRQRKTGYLSNRDATLSNLASGKYESRSLLWVDPAECRIWEHHNRRYDLLTEQRCADLIEGLKAIGRQEFPAVVRPLPKGSDYHYEVIAGARRHWTVSWLRANNYPEFKFLIDVRADLTDEEAFRISDAENRDREDISDYERAIDYKRAMGLYYRTQKDMAERLEVSEGWLSRYLLLAELPAAVVQAYADLRDIRVQHGRELRVLLKSKAGIRSLEKEAARIAAEQGERQSAGKAPLDGNQVLARFRSIGKRPKQPAAVKLPPLKAGDGATLLSGTYSPRAGWTLKISPRAGEAKDQVLAAIGEALDEPKS